jgi:rhomboid family GlyGly-CTERM serine protease
MGRQANKTHGRFRLPWVTLALAAACLGLFAVFGGAPPSLVYDRLAVDAGEIWRLVTGHLVHLDPRHLVYNMGALLALGAAYEAAPFGGPRRLTLGVFGLGGVLITATLIVASPATLYYCGLSAILNTLYATLTLGMWRETRQPLWLLAFAADVAKIGFEAVWGPIFSSGLAWPPHIGAHVAGLTAGCLVALGGRETVYRPAAAH